MHSGGATEKANWCFFFLLHNSTKEMMPRGRFTSKDAESVGCGTTLCCKNALFRNLFELATFADNLFVGPLWYKAVRCTERQRTKIDIWKMQYKIGWFSNTGKLWHFEVFPGPLVRKRYSKDPRSIQLQNGILRNMAPHDEKWLTWTCLGFSNISIEVFFKLFVFLLILMSQLLIWGAKPKIIPDEKRYSYVQLNPLCCCSLL